MTLPSFFCLYQLLKLVSCDWSDNIGAIDVKMDGSVLEERSCWGWLSCLNWIGALTLSLLLKLASKKIGVMIGSVKFLSPEVALCLYKSLIWSCMEYL